MAPFYQPHPLAIGYVKLAHGCRAARVAGATCLTQLTAPTTRTYYYASGCKAGYDAAASLPRMYLIPAYELFSAVQQPHSVTAMQ